MEAYPETVGTDDDGRKFSSLVLRRCPKSEHEEDPRPKLAVEIITDSKMGLNMSELAEQMASRNTTEDLTESQLENAKEGMRSYLRLRVNWLPTLTRRARPRTHHGCLRIGGRIAQPLRFAFPSEPRCGPELHAPPRRPLSRRMGDWQVFGSSKMALHSVFTPIACSACFTDAGLRMDAEAIGHETTTNCPNCGKSEGRKLEKEDLKKLAHRFFVWGSFLRCEYGGAPTIQFNEHQKTSITVSPWLSSDIKLFERVLGVGFFDYGPRLWMVGEVEPLKDLQNSRTRESAIRKIIQAYPDLMIGRERTFYRIRIGPKHPAEIREYDSPPDEFVGHGRMDSRGLPVLYASPDLELCIHECRVAAEDDSYVATLSPRSSLRLLDLSVVSEEGNVTEFESVDMATHMLFLAGEHAYAILREIALSAKTEGFDGIVYPSYFSLLRLGTMPFPTIYGISTRRIPQYKGYEQSKSVPNLALFGRPVDEGKVSVECINRLIIRRVAYDFHFGPLQSI